jgi:hypothetical protein
MTSSSSSSSALPPCRCTHPWDCRRTRVDAHDLFTFPPLMSQPDILAQIRDGFADLPGVLDLVCNESPAQHLYTCTCGHIAESMAATIDVATVRGCAERFLATSCGLPRVVADIIGRFAAVYKVSSFTHAAAIRQAPRALERLHAQWYKISTRLWWLNDDEYSGDCISCRGCSKCHNKAAERQELRRSARRLVGEHKDTCARLTSILMDRP